MKDTKRKVHDWDNSNYIMEKYGKSIRSNLADTIMEAHSSIRKYERIDFQQRYELYLTPKEKCGTA